MHYLTNVNKYPKTEIEKRLFRLREKFNKKHNLSRLPNPIKTENVIYCLYSTKKSANLLYVGQTTTTAYNRLQQHCHAKDNTVIHKYIQTNGPENLL